MPAWAIAVAIVVVIVLFAVYKYWTAAPAAKKESAHKEGLYTKEIKALIGRIEAANPK